MESILQELYFGNINPCERERVHAPEYAALTKKINEMDVHFKNKLSREEYDKLQEMLGLRADADLFEEAALFGYAFSIGALLMLDVFGHNQLGVSGTGGSD